MMGITVLVFSVSFGLAFLGTPLVRKLVQRFGLLDRPDEARKLQTVPVPLGGGVAIFFAWVVAVGVLWFLRPEFFVGYLEGRKLLAVTLAGLWLMASGLVDDARKTKPLAQLVSVIIAILIAMSGGVGITTLTNPLGGVAHVDWLWRFELAGVIIPVVSLVLTGIWLLVTTFSIKLFDGLDGLATGVGALGGFALFALSLAPPVLQSGTALLGLALAGSCLGFLVWNFSPARIFLGQAGSLWLGFMLGALAIIAGGKIATTLLILALPLLDMLVVIGWRLFKLKQSPFLGDRWHLHFRLVDLGWSVPRAVVTVYAIVALFMVAGVFSSSLGRLILLTLLTLLTLLVEWLLLSNHGL